MRGEIAVVFDQPMPYNYECQLPRPVSSPPALFEAQRRPWQATQMHHYTDQDGFHAVGCAPTWRFVAGCPPGNHPFGAYFTTFGPEVPHLAKKLRIPRTKLEFAFEFTGNDGLEPLDGGRGAFIFFSRTDYVVAPPRQVFKGATGL